MDDSSLNYLEKAMIYGCINEASATREKCMKQEAIVIREKLFNKTTSRQKWPKILVPGSAVEIRDNKNQITYSGKLPNSFIKQRQIYDLFLSQLVPPMNPFRSNIEANLGIVVDRTKLFISTKFLSFCWRSTHGLINSNRDYKRFGVKEDENCYCGETQNLQHLMVECQRSTQLFANFQVQYKLQEQLTQCEKLMGIDPKKTRTKAVLKKLAILRNAIIMSNYRDEVLRWETVLHKVDQVYVSEFAVANRREKLVNHFRSWDM